jgi:hypothetical protein
MKTQGIPLIPARPKGASTVHTVALATFKFVRKAGVQAATIPGMVQASASDIATAWADSRPTGQGGRSCLQPDS